VHSVGIIANPASGRDIRRLVTGASVFDNAEKGSMVGRLMAGLGAVGVTHVLVMPAGDGVSGSLRRYLGGTDGRGLPELEFLDMPLTGTAEDTATAVDRMVERKVAAIVVLGGDGTHRVVTKRSGAIPLCALSTGTNNAFPEMREATVAGVATGLVVTGRVTAPAVLRREKVWRVAVERESGRIQDRALVDVALATGRWVGARALWRTSDVVEFLVSFARPGAVGLSAIAGMVRPVDRAAPHGVHVCLADPADAEVVVHAALAPGLVVPVGVAGTRAIEPGEVVEPAPPLGCLALDGEREVELTPDDRVTATLGTGVVTIDVDAVMAEAARAGVMAQPSARLA
jgi:predicted polyphosphate/ATP-dependent NAD kinase